MIYVHILTAVKSFHNAWDATQYIKDTYKPEELKKLIEDRNITIINGQEMKIDLDSESPSILEY